MKTHHQILIVGGGNAGISLAAQLFRKDASLDIGIVEPSEKHYYQPAWTLVGAGVFDIRKTIRNQADVMPRKAKWIKDAVVAFDPQNNAINTASGQSYTYDYLVVCPGIQLDWHKVKGLEGNVGKHGICSNYSFQTAPYTWEVLRQFKGGKALFTNPNTPVKCGGAPQKIMYLVGDYFRKHGLSAKSEVHFYSAGGVIFGIKRYADTLNKAIARYGIKTHFLHNLVELKPEEKIAVFDVYENGQVVNQVSEHYDMIHVTPPQSAPDFIKNSPFALEGNPLGWMEVDKYTFQSPKHANVFGIGDATNTPNAKTGAAVRKQVPVLVKHLISLIRNNTLADAKYSGYGSCPLVTGYGKLVLAEFDYNNEPMETFPFDQSKERWSMYMLKRWVLPWLYWNKILKGTA